MRPRRTRASTPRPRMSASGPHPPARRGKRTGAQRGKRSAARELALLDPATRISGAIRVPCGGRCGVRAKRDRPPDRRAPKGAGRNSPAGSLCRRTRQALDETPRKGGARGREPVAGATPSATLPLEPRAMRAHGEGVLLRSAERTAHGAKVAPLPRANFGRRTFARTGRARGRPRGAPGSGERRSRGSGCRRPGARRRLRSSDSRLAAPRREVRNESARHGGNAGAAARGPMRKLHARGSSIQPHLEALAWGSALGVLAHVGPPRPSLRPAGPTTARIPSRQRVLAHPAQLRRRCASSPPILGKG